MATRAFLISQTLEVDAARKSVVFAPTRWMGLVFGPAFAAVPAALLWIRTLGTYELTFSGWVITVAWSLFAIASTAMFLGPNRRVSIDLDRGRISIGRPYGIGRPVETAVADAEIRLDESVVTMPNSQNRSPRAKLTATIDGRPHVIAYLANSGVPIAQELTRVLGAARHGDRPSLDTLERATRALEGVKWKMLGLMTAMALVGAFFALYYGGIV